MALRMNQVPAALGTREPQFAPEEVTGARMLMTLLLMGGVWYGLNWLGKRR